MSEPRSPKGRARLWAAVRAGAAHPPDWTLGEYAFALRDAGLTAAEQFPDVAAHLAAGCEACEEALRELSTFAAADERIAQELRVLGAQPRPSRRRDRAAGRPLSESPLPWQPREPSEETTVVLAEFERRLRVRYPDHQTVAARRQIAAEALAAASPPPPSVSDPSNLVDRHSALLDRLDALLVALFRTLGFERWSARASQRRTQSYTPRPTDSLEASLRYLADRIDRSTALLSSEEYRPYEAERADLGKHSSRLMRDLDRAVAERERTTQSLRVELSSTRPGRRRALEGRLRRVRAELVDLRAASRNLRDLTDALRSLPPLSDAGRS